MPQSPFKSFRMKQFRFIACIAILFSIFQPVAAQNFAYQKAEVYLLNGDFSGTKDINSATYLLQVTKYSDTLYTCRYYRKFGPMLKQESFLDADFSTPNGMFGWYDEKGNYVVAETSEQAVQIFETKYNLKLQTSNLKLL